MQLICSHCLCSFERSKRNCYHTAKNNQKFYCSRNCLHLSQKNHIEVICKECNKIFHKKQSEYCENNFCSRSCSASYNNKHKKHGVRRSKLEKYLEEQLSILYADLVILFNSKEQINSELDIFIPELNLDFELNGIFHYEPIFGDSKLTQIQNNDARKFQACLEKGIELCIIDTSTQKYFKQTTSKKFLDIIVNIINHKRKMRDSNPQPF